MILFGASGHAKVIIEIAESIGVKVDRLFDDNDTIKTLLNYQVYHSSLISNFLKEQFIITIGNNRIRKEISSRYCFKYSKALVHPKSCLSKRSIIDEGSVIMGNSIINCDTRIGKHVIVNTSSSIDHDCIISDFVHISPNATLSGGIEVGEGVHIGAAASIIPNIKIGSWSVIGAGSVIIRDVPDNAVVVGNPGRIVKYNN